MRPPLALVVLGCLLLAGCAGPAAEPSPPSEGPIELSEDLRGIILVDLRTREVVALSPTPGNAWMSPSGQIVVYPEVGFHVLSNRTLETVQPAAAVGWSRIEDDVTGVVLEPGRAVRKLLTNGTDLTSATLPESPAPTGAWGGVSADLVVLGAEWSSSDAPACRSSLAILDTATGGELSRAGCHLRVARDGRVGWTEATGVWVRERNGTVRDVTGTGRDVQGTFVAHENPVFTADGLVYLRLSGAERLARTEVVTEDGRALAKIEGDHRLALLDVSADGDALLLSAFQR